jgi:hypothetical protein
LWSSNPMLTCVYDIMFSGSTRIWIQNVMLTRQAFYYLSHTLSPLCFTYFSDRVLYFGLSYPQTMVLLSVLLIAVITDTSHRVQLVFWDRVLLIFISMLPSKPDSLFSSSLAAMIIDVHHYAWPLN